MNVFNDSGQIDSEKFLDYAARQLSSDVANLIKVRDEMALRQGALTAVQDAAKLRSDAQVELASAKDAASAMRAEAQRQLHDAKLLKEELAANLQAYDKQAETFNRDSTAKWAELAAREKVVAMKEADLVSREEDLRFAADKLRAEREQLNAKIKSFQDKVASLGI